MPRPFGRGSASARPRHAALTAAAVWRSRPRNTADSTLPSGAYPTGTPGSSRPRYVCVRIWENHAMSTSKAREVQGGRATAFYALPNARAARVRTCGPVCGRSAGGLLTRNGLASARNRGGPDAGGGDAGRGAEFVRPRPDGSRSRQGVGLGAGRHARRASVLHDVARRARAAHPCEAPTLVRPDGWKLGEPIGHSIVSQLPVRAASMRYCLGLASSTPRGSRPPAQSWSPQATNLGERL